MIRRAEPERLAGREPDGDLAVAIGVAEQELPGAGGEDLSSLGDDAVGLAEVLVVGPEQVRGLVGTENSKVRSARIASTSSTSMGVSPRLVKVVVTRIEGQPSSSV